MAEALALEHLGEAYMVAGQLDDAIEQLKDSASTYKELGHLAGQDFTLSNLGVAYIRRGEWQTAEDFLLFHTAGDAYGEGLALFNIGALYLQLKDDRSAGYISRAFEILEPLNAPEVQRMKDILRSSGK